ncbi:MAG: hypothetical protein AB7R89_22320 [Dehalococcoidia bacterium]
MAELVKDESDEQRDDEGDEEDENGLKTILPDEKLKNGTPYLRSRLRFQYNNEAGPVLTPDPSPAGRERGAWSDQDHLFAGRSNCTKALVGVHGCMRLPSPAERERGRG